MPSPVTALTATEPGCSTPSAPWRRPGARSALLNTSSSGTWSAPISRSTSRTAAIWPVRVGGAGVDDVHQVVGAGGDLERALERLDQPVRQAAHEPDRVGEQHRLATGQRQAARRRVERGEQPVLDEHAGVRSAG